MRYTTGLATVIRVLYMVSFLIFELLSLVDATDQYNFFIEPTVPGPNQDYTDNPSWSLGSTQKIRWATSYENYSINLWQQSPNSQQGEAIVGPTIFCSAPLVHPITTRKLTDAEAKASEDRDASEFSWAVETYTFDLFYSPIFFLWVTTTTTASSFTSHYFNITEEENSTSSSTRSTAISTSTSASSAISTQSSSAPPTSTSASSATPTSTSNKDDDDLSSGAKAGIGVGAALGGAILILLSVVVALMLRKRNKRRHTTPPSSYPSDEINRSFPGERPPQVYSLEMEGDQVPVMADRRKTAKGLRVELE